MDAIAGLLDGPRARGAFLLRSTLAPPWCLRIQDEAPLTVIAIVRGSAYVRRRCRSCEAGDVAIARGPDPYTVADDPATSPQAVDRTRARSAGCRTARIVKLMDFLGTRTWGNAPDGDTVMLTGTYEHAGEISARLLRALPPLLPSGSTRRSSSCWPTRSSRTQPGQEAVLDRLLDLLLIAVAARPLRRTTDAPGWYRARAGPDRRARR